MKDEYRVLVALTSELNHAKKREDKDFIKDIITKKIKQFDKFKELEDRIQVLETKVSFQG